LPYAEPNFNVSTFTARVVTSTLPDIYNADTAVIGAVKGPSIPIAPGRGSWPP
jgi:2-methylcitrate synthase